jgi:LysM repeat protein
MYPGEKVHYPAIRHVYGAGYLTGGKWVTIQAWSVNLRVTGSLGPAGMVITGGGPEWEEIKIPRGDSYSQWNGRQLYTATLDILFDGWGPTRRSVEPELIALDQLANRLSGMLTPPRLRIWGAIPKWGIPWVIPGIDYGDAIRDTRSGNRVRQACTVHLLEYRGEEAVAVTPRAAAKPKHVQKYKVKHGDTLKSIAAKILGNSNKWQVIARANNGLRGWQIPKSFIGKTIKVPLK